MSGENLNNQTIGSNDCPCPIEFVNSDDETPKTPMAANQQPKMVLKEGTKTEADFGNGKDQEQAEYAKQNIIDYLDNLDKEEQDQPSAIASFLQEEVSTYLCDYVEYQLS